MKKILICLLFIINLSSISQAQNVNKMLGDNYYKHLAYSKAIKYYEKALKKDSSDLHVLKHLAQSYKNRGDFNKAEDLYHILYTKNDTSSMQDYAKLLIYNNKYNSADSILTLFNCSLANYDKKIIDTLLNAEPDYNITLTGINSQYSDFRPCFSYNSLIFSSARDTSKKEYEWNGQPYLSLYRANVNKDGSLRDATSFTKVDSRYHISSYQYVRAEGITFYTMNYANSFSGVRDINNEVNLGIYTSKNERGAWQKPQLVESISSKEYNTAHPFFSSYDDRLYFSSNRPGGFGGSDIYYADVYGGGIVGEPVNCGESINTPGDEMYPFVHTNGVLYFSSDGHPGLGGLDVFSVQMKDDEFKEVKNLGLPINSSRDDFSFILKEDETIGYLASNRTGGIGDDDIYMVKMLPKHHIMDKRTVHAVISSKGSSVVNTTLLVGITATTTGNLPNLISDPGDEANKVLTIESVSDILNNPQPESSTSSKDQLKNLKLRLYNIQFDFNQWDINEKAANELDKLVALLNKHSSMTIELSSHTDCRGNNDYNTVLSQARADAALKYILKQDINISRIKAIGYGEQILLNECNDGVDCPEELHQENRRVEVLITNY